MNKVVPVVRYVAVLLALVFIYFGMLWVGGKYVEYKQADIFEVWKDSGGADLSILNSMSREYFSSPKFRDIVRNISSIPVFLMSTLLAFFLNKVPGRVAAPSALFLAGLAYLVNFDVLLTIAAVVGLLIGKLTTLYGNR